MSEDSSGLRTVGHSDLGGYGDGMQVLREGDAVYVGHFGPTGAGTSILDASDPSDLRLVRQWTASSGPGAPTRTSRRSRRASTTASGSSST